MKYLFITFILVTIAISCSKGGTCDCVDTRSENGTLIETTTSSSESKGIQECEQHVGTTDTVSGVWVVRNHNCEFSN